MLSKTEGADGLRSTPSHDQKVTQPEKIWWIKSVPFSNKRCFESLQFPLKRDFLGGVIISRKLLAAFHQYHLQRDLKIQSFRESIYITWRTNEDRRVKIYNGMEIRVWHLGYANPGMLLPKIFVDSTLPYRNFEAENVSPHWMETDSIHYNWHTSWAKPQ